MQRIDKAGYLQSIQVGLMHLGQLESINFPAHLVQNLDEF